MSEGWLPDDCLRREINLGYRAFDLAAQRLLDARGAIFVAFDSLECGVTAEEMWRLWKDSPHGRAHPGGEPFGAALGVALIAVEADRLGGGGHE